MKFTILGASGFIGSHLRNALETQGHQCFCPGREDPAIFENDLGHVLFCVGLTADFRARPFDTVEAHVCLLSKVLRRCRFESFLYLSSTRVYLGAESGREDEALRLAPEQKESLFNASKLAGEALCLSCSRHGVKVARISNVVGDDFRSDNFLYAIIKEAVNTGRVRLQTALNSEKDYVDIRDVVALLPLISCGGTRAIYNVASGANTSHSQLITAVVGASGCQYEVTNGAATIRFPVIDTTRIAADFDFSARPILARIPDLVRVYRQLASAS